LAFDGDTPHRTSNCATLTGSRGPSDGALRKNAAHEPENLSMSRTCTRGPRRSLNKDFIAIYLLHNGVRQPSQIGQSEPAAELRGHLDVQAAQNQTASVQGRRRHDFNHTHRRRNLRSDDGIIRLIVVKDDDDIASAP
jgi:hypothetical protein